MTFLHIQPCHVLLLRNVLKISKILLAEKGAFVFSPERPRWPSQARRSVQRTTPKTNKEATVPEELDGCSLQTENMPAELNNRSTSNCQLPACEPGMCLCNHLEAEQTATGLRPKKKEKERKKKKKD